MSGITAIIAVIFSLGTTIVSAYNSHKLDVRENRREARELMQRLNKLPIENFELLEKYKYSASGQALSGLIISENVLLAIQASELIERYPSSFNSVEYFTVASALASSNIDTKVQPFYLTAIEKADTSIHFVSSSIAYAEYLYSKGKNSEAARHFQNSLDTWEKFPEDNKIFINTMNTQTCLRWAGVLSIFESREAAKQKLDLAESYLKLVPDLDSRNKQLKNQFDALSKMLDQKK